MSPRVTGLVIVFAILAVLAPVRSLPTPLRIIPRHEGHHDSSPTTGSSSATSLQTQNALDAQKLNAQFSSLKPTDSCKDGENACVTNKFAQCVAGKWVLTPCAADLVCVALPLVNKEGTSLSCDSRDDALRRFEDAGVDGTGAGDDDDDDDGNGDEECEAEGDDSPISLDKVPTSSSTTQYKRQVSTMFTVIPSSVVFPPTAVTEPATQSASDTVVPSVSVSVTTVFVPATATSVSSTATSSSSIATLDTNALPTNTQVTLPTSTSNSNSSTTDGIEPTGIVIGADGIRTVTVTVNCGPESTGIISNSTSTSSGIVPTSTGIVPTSTDIVPTSTETGTSPVTVTVFVTSSASASTVPSLSSVLPILSSSSDSIPSESVSATDSASASTATDVADGRISFSTAPAPTPTPAPAPVEDVNNGVNNGADVSRLLTATIGSA